MKYAITLLTLAILSMAASCGGDDDTVVCDTDNITYTNMVEGFIENAGCAATGTCHGPHQTGNFSLATYDDVINYKWLDRMVSALRWESGFEQMPRDSMTNLGREMLPECDILKIEAWIAAGTPE